MLGVEWMQVAVRRLELFMMQLFHRLQQAFWRYVFATSFLKICFCNKLSEDMFLLQAFWRYVLLQRHIKYYSNLKHETLKHYKHIIMFYFTWTLGLFMLQLFHRLQAFWRCVLLNIQIGWHEFNIFKYVIRMLISDMPYMNKLGKVDVIDRHCNIRRPYPLDLPLLHMLSVI